MENKIKTRNYGIDIFKIFSMFMVVAVHMMDGVVPGCQSGTTNEYIAKFIQTFFFFAVNCFALSSGFVQCNIEYKFNRIVRMWLQVFFYSFVITILFFIFAPDLCSKGTLLLSMFPFISSRYWYFSSYVVLFLLTPYINNAMQNMTKKQHAKLSVVLFIIFSIIPVIAFDVSTFNTNLGFSFFWLCIVYIWGAYLGKYGLTIKTKNCVIVFLVCVILTFLSRFQFGVENIPVLSYITANWELYRYDSPAMVIGSIALLIMFTKIKVNNEKVIKLIKIVTPLTFSVYLIHNNQLIKNNIVYKYFPRIGELSTISMVLASIGIIISVFIVCLCIDWIRLKIFKLIKADKISEKISSFIENIVAKLVSKIADN